MSRDLLVKKTIPLKGITHQKIQLNMPSGRRVTAGRNGRTESGAEAESAAEVPSGGESALSA